MCLFIDEEKHPVNQPAVVVKPLIVFKVLGFNNKSPYYSFPYGSNYHYSHIQLKPETKVEEGYNIIERGYHAFTRFHVARESCWSDEKTALCKIPTGAEIYISSAYEIVASEFITGDLTPITAWPPTEPKEVTSWKKLLGKK